MEVTSSSETSVDFQCIAHRYIPDDAVLKRTSLVGGPITLEALDDTLTIELLLLPAKSFKITYSSIC
jgi:hypothetical protein